MSFDLQIIESILENLPHIKKINRKQYKKINIKAISTIKIDDKKNLSIYE